MKRLLQTLILTTTFFSLVSCDKNNNLLQHTVDNPVSAEIDGALFQSAPEKILNYGGDVHQLIESDDEFVFITARRISSNERSYTIRIEMNHNESFELNKRYTFNGEVTDDYYIIGLLLDTDEKWLEHGATSGWIEFTELSKGYHTYVSGKFEMECIDSDNSSIEVKNGEFGPLRVSYDYIKG